MAAEPSSPSIAETYYIVIMLLKRNLFNFPSFSVRGFYQQLVEDLLLCPEAPVLVFMSCSAHPAMWIVARNLKSVPWIGI